MAVQAKLLVDGAFYNLKSFQYGFVKDSDVNGMSNGKTRQTGISCEIEAVRDEVFEEWAYEGFMKKYVEIHMVQSISGMGKTRILKCHDTFLLGLNSRFSSTTEEPMNFQLQMKSGVIEASWSTEAHIEQWSALPEEGEMTVIEDNELILDSVHYEDGNGQKITELENGKVYLVINSQNGDGKFVDIDLTDREHDFMFGGVRVEEDILTEVPLKGDVTKILLEVIDEQNPTI